VRGCARAGCRAEDTIGKGSRFHPLLEVQVGRASTKDAGPDLTLSALLPDTSSPESLHTHSLDSPSDLVEPLCSDTARFRYDIDDDSEIWSTHYEREIESGE
jgi:hypothetical protein